MVRVEEGRVGGRCELSSCLSFRLCSFSLFARTASPRSWKVVLECMVGWCCIVWMDSGLADRPKRGEKRPYREGGHQHNFILHVVPRPRKPSIRRNPLHYFPEGRENDATDTMMLVERVSSRAPPRLEVSPIPTTSSTETNGRVSLGRIIGLVVI